MRIADGFMGRKSSLAEASCCGCAFVVLISEQAETWEPFAVIHKRPAPMVITGAGLCGPEVSAGPFRGGHIYRF